MSKLFFLFKALFKKVIFKQKYCLFLNLSSFFFQLLFLYRPSFTLFHWRGKKKEKPLKKPQTKEWCQKRCSPQVLINKLDLLKIEASNLQEMMQFNFTVSNYLLKRSQQAMCCSCGCWLATINSGAMVPPSGHHTDSQYPYKVSRKQSWYQTLLICTYTYLYPKKGKMILPDSAEV